jgi:arginine/ornithine transport system substrate-binding protein
MADSVAMADGFLNTDDGAGFEFVGPDFTDPAYFGDGAGIAVRKGEDELREMFNDAIRAIRDKGIYQEINARYFDFDVYGG